jgi:hypothetical protein
MNKKIMSAYMIAVTFVVTLFVNGNTIYADRIECEDIKGVEKWSSEGHDDNNPSEKKFYKALEEKTFCEVNEMIDHEEVEGEIKEDSKHDLDWLKETIYYQSVDEEVQECIDDAYEDSPDEDGDDNAADYEMLECGY